MPESSVLQAAALMYAVAAALSWQALARPGSAVARPHAALALAGAVALHTLAIVMRWLELGHGPFTTMHESLSSNLWSLALIVALAGAALREVRTALWAAAPLLLLLTLWMMVSDPRPGHLPPTYDTPLLYLHTLVGKLFLGLLLVAVALGAVPWLRRTRWGRLRTAAWPGEARFDELAHRFAAFALVFDTLMLIVGAVWAQDAWGRYWDWDPLESWAFVTWLALVASLHARSTLRPSAATHGLWLAAVFVIAFLTFFGVPFIATAPHKGAV